MKPRELIVQHFPKALYSMEAGAVSIYVNTQRYVDIWIIPINCLLKDTEINELWVWRTVEQGVLVNL